LYGDTFPWHFSRLQYFFCDVLPFKNQWKKHMKYKSKGPVKLSSVSKVKMETKLFTNENVHSIIFLLQGGSLHLKRVSHIGTKNDPLFYNQEGH
jgi:hypothetical protein